VVVWIIGLSGAGKTTVGRALYAKCKEVNPATVFLDGDIIREIIGDNLGHTIDARRKNAERINRLCLYLDKSGINVVCSLLSIFPEYQELMRKECSSYFQVYLKADMDELVRLDTKGIYKTASKDEKPNIVGLDIEFPEPLNSDFVVQNVPYSAAPDEIAEDILKLIASKL